MFLESTMMEKNVPTRMLRDLLFHHQNTNSLS